jgi:hypothetical protein
MTVPAEGDPGPQVLARPNVALRRRHPERKKRSAPPYFLKGACPLTRRLTRTKSAKKLSGHLFKLSVFRQLGLDESQFWFLPFFFAAGGKRRLMLVWLR